MDVALCRAACCLASASKPTLLFDKGAGYRCEDVEVEVVEAHGFVN